LGCVEVVEEIREVRDRERIVMWLRLVVGGGLWLQLRRVKRGAFLMKHERTKRAKRIG